MKKALPVILICLAVIAASAAAIVVSMNRAAVARSQAEIAASEESRAELERKAERDKAQAEADNRRAAEASAKAAADQLAAAKLAKEQAVLDQQTAADNLKAKEVEAARAKDEAMKSAAARDAAMAAKEQARLEKETADKQAAAAAAEERAKAAALETERLSGEKVIAEAKMLELRKIDFETLQRDFNEWRLSLEAREAALAPEKTIADLAWAGGQEDMTVDENGNLTNIVKVAYSPETDRSLPRSTRALAKAERLRHEAATNELAQVRAAVVRPLEKLYVQAIREDRVVDADYYAKTLKALYPDWEFKGE